MNAPLYGYPYDCADFVEWDASEMDARPRKKRKRQRSLGLLVCVASTLLFWGPVAILIF